ncbi:MAG: SDR family NAD(P)-dependent oxidoreductase [Pyrinomonadaceae bacterium]
MGRKQNMESEFSGKIVLVTGATSGIGRASVLRFAEAGASIAAVGRNEAALATLAKEIEGIGGKALTLRADLSVGRDIGLVVSQTMNRFSGIDILVNAGPY